MKSLQEVKSSLKYLRIAPRKVRLVADLIKNKPVDVAAAILEVTNKRAAPHILKLLKSAIANAQNNFKIPPSKLFVKSIRVDGGPMLKRWMPRARGAAYLIQKKTSHIFLVLGVKEKDEEMKFPALVEEKKKKKEEKKTGEKKKEDKHEHIKLEKEEKEEIKSKEGKEEKRRIFRKKAI